MIILQDRLAAGLFLEFVTELFHLSYVSLVIHVMIPLTYKRKANAHSFTYETIDDLGVQH